MTDQHGHGQGHEHAHGHGHAGHGRGPAVGHEVTDASLGGVEKFMVVLVAFLAVAFGLMWFMYRQLQGREAAQDVRPSPVVARQGDRQPPVPRLQTMPELDLAAYQRAERDVLEGWAWVDKGRGIAQIPIARAIEILAERGLPTPPPAAAQPSPGAAPVPAPSTPAAGQPPGGGAASRPGASTDARR
jgi:hypothetical protein